MSVDELPLLHDFANVQETGANSARDSFQSLPENLKSSHGLLRPENLKRGLLRDSEPLPELDSSSALVAELHLFSVSGTIFGLHTQHIRPTAMHIVWSLTVFIMILTFSFVYLAGSFTDVGDMKFLIMDFRPLTGLPWTAKASGLLINLMPAISMALLYKYFRQGHFIKLLQCTHKNDMKSLKYFSNVCCIVLWVYSVATLSVITALDWVEGEYMSGM
jgi:hypothetical protein